MEKKFKIIDLFAGVGGIRIGFEKTGYYETVFSNDMDIKCNITYKDNFNKENNSYSMEVCKIEKLDISNIPTFDILTGGFPCQPFSIAGKQEGFNDSKGRGNVFFEIVKILKLKKPKAFLLENVKNLTKQNKGKSFEIILQELRDLGYFVTYGVLNTMDYANIAQNRERVYIVGFLDKTAFDNFKFPSPIPLTTTIHNFLEKDKVAEKYYYSKSILYPILKESITNKNTVYQWRRKYVRENKKGVCPTLTANMGTGGHNVPLILDNWGIRKLTPRECFNFQGFPDSFILPEHLSDSQLYKQAGNSVSIKVIERIAENMAQVL